jgi:[glutamine synthetase] adenylyltransferase / [glutamine synthetase]-adenylyl-L-tyrosine phosphorylase
VIPVADALGRAERHSPYLRLLMRRFPEVVDQLERGLSLADYQLFECETNRPLGTIPQTLRIAKGRLALALAISDLAAVITLDQVIAHLSHFADHALDLALAAAFEAIVPGAAPQGFAIIALGKHGSGELNYSSDIDPILIFDPETIPTRARDEPVETAVRIARKLVDIMQMRDGDGYVFRVDLRLRPSPEVTPLAIPIDAAIGYYESSALAWERAAFIRARSCAGDRVLGERFLKTIQPFIWRRGLDFGAISEIRGISRRIRAAYAAGQMFGPGYDLKRGRGGIRECEFFAQIHQMIHGGRDPSVRVAATQGALEALSAAGWIDRKEANTLIDAYRLYRTIEHRLQMVDDQQTHSLPRETHALAGVARLHGLESGDALLELLRPHIDAVGALYDQLDGTGQTGLPHETEALTNALTHAGVAAPPEIARRIDHWRSGTIRALRSAAAQQAFEAVLPAIVTAFAAAPDPMIAVNRFDQLIERLPSAVNLFRLLEARPPLLTLLTAILCHAPALAEELARRADLLDGLIDASALLPVGDVDMIATRLRHQGSIEDQLDWLRRIVSEMRFALGVQIVHGVSDPLDVAAGYARVAEAAVRTVADAVIGEFERVHGRVPDSELVILALGRLGGASLTHASDLDLIYIFTGDFNRESGGAKPLGAVHYYNRLAQRVTAGLSVSTAAGPLYEVDTRLRPSGAKGPLSVSLDGFARYQSHEAWTWEHMALTRARVIYGSAAAHAATEAVIADVLTTPRDQAVLRADVIKMRIDIAMHKPAKSDFDVKMGEGGLVDLEFCLHLRQLQSGSGLNPQIGSALKAVGLDHLSASYALLTRFLVTMRLVAPDMAAPARATQPLVARACGAEDWQSLLVKLMHARQSIADEWQRSKGN